jgi:hypothetical protein
MVSEEDFFHASKSIVFVQCQFDQDVILKRMIRYEGLCWLTVAMVH